MWPYYFLGGLAVVAIALVFMFATRKKPSAASRDPKATLKELLQTGVMYEEEFIDTYFHVIRDEGFMDNFGANKDEANRLLTTMIEESKGHKALLENVLANLK